MKEARILTLTIKREFFNKILKGEKDKEYRNFNEYFKTRLVDYKPTHLKLHYQSKDFLIVEIKKISLIKKPLKFKDSTYFTSNKCYEIKLGKSKLL